MRENIKKIAITALFLCICGMICIYIKGNIFETEIRWAGDIKTEDLHISFDKEDILEIRQMEVKDHIVSLSFRARKPGRVDVKLENEKANSINKEEYHLYLKVNKFLKVFDENRLDFTGYKEIIFMISLFFIVFSFVLLNDFRKSRKNNLYSYDTIYDIGFGLFVLSIAMMFAISCYRCISTPADYGMSEIYHTITEFSGTYMFLTAPFLFLFAISMISSNISLLCHERVRFANMLGIFTGIIVIAGEIIAFLIDYHFSGSYLQYKILAVVSCAYKTIFVYFECMLQGVIICALFAAYHLPERNKDYIVILGCGIAKDGSLLPLLRDRVDRAIMFYQRQLEETGKKAVFVPSGGKGADEVISEAEAMKRYLISKGFSEEQILTEEESKNTRQNMQFSKQKIEKNHPDAKAAFSTTNYHVFRIGMLARSVGFVADGMGSRTKWYFGPNAFVREFVGLMMSEIKKKVVVFVGMVGLFTILPIVLN